MCSNSSYLIKILKQGNSFLAGVSTFRCHLAFALNHLPGAAEMCITSDFVLPPGNRALEEVCLTLSCLNF